ncbi:MAG: 23S rRNA (adenine(2503)-C(2))-methyltransferase RlmN, partial [bacterium]|nr:23S rRNA (adenine(2503)-C(2))-methyltransferase RlmN [bacterium]
AFINELRETGTNATLRTSRGADIAAACGQLRGNLQKHKSGPAATDVATDPL